MKQLIDSRRLSTLLALCILLPILSVCAAYGGTPGATNDPQPSAVNFSVTTLDKDNRTPLELVRVALLRGKSVLMTKTTNTAGRATFIDIPSGWYTISTRRAGYHTYSDSVLIDSAHTADTISLAEVQQRELVVNAARSQVEHVVTSVDVRSGAQVFEGETYHAPPAARMTNLIQQNVTGAVKASTGEVHIRGQHGEFTYYVDGVPIPLGVFGGLNEVVDSKVIDRATFYTGGFPAEYGGQMAAVIDLQTGVPAGRFHVDASSYVGSYLTSSGDSLGSRVGAFRALNSNGQSLSVSNQHGNFGFFLSGSRQETDHRIDQPTPALFHDHGFDYFLYGKGHYVFSDRDYVTLNLNYGVTRTEVPYDPVEGIQQDEQHTYNAFQTLSYFHTFSSEANRQSNLFVGAFAREGGLRFIPSLNDDNKQYLAGDTTHGYVVDEDRRFTTTGLRAKYDVQLSHQLGIAAGFGFSGTMGTEDFKFMSTEIPGPHTVTDYSGSDLGGFAQGQWHPLEWGQLDLGIRYDRHTAPDAPTESAISPRVKLSFFPDETSTIYLYYGRLFMPTNIEGLRSVATQVGDSSEATLPERDNFYEAVYTQSWGFGLTSKVAAFHKDASPGLDDETLGSSSIKTPVNISSVSTNGLELALSYSDPSSPISTYANTSIIHAYGHGPIVGGFLAADSSTAAFDLDHDQRLSVVLGLNYQPTDWFANLSATYSSGLTNGNEDITFKTGLVDFNQAGHTTPGWAINASAGYTFKFDNGMSLEPSLYVTNLLDHQRLIKGAFFSGASFEERRNVVFRLSYHL